MDRILVQRQSVTLLEYLLDREKTRIGSYAGSDISFAGEADVSENHAEVLKGPAGYRIADLGSAGGTFVNGERIKEKELCDGDNITIGGFTLVCLNGPAGGYGQAAQEAALPASGEAEPSADGAPSPEAFSGPAAQAGPAWDGESTMIIARKAETPAPEAAAPPPAPEVRPEAAEDDFAATIATPPPVQEPAPAPQPAAREEEAENRFAVTSILKVPRKNKTAPGSASAAPDLEEGVIEIEVLRTVFWSRKRLVRAAYIAGAAACALAGLAVLRSLDLRALLLPRSQLTFNVTPADAQVCVNGVDMPMPGSGVLRNVPAGRFSVKVSHPGYPEAMTINVETGLFKRRIAVASAPGGISSK
ncbi:MAG TPA: hypothetical protein DCS63_02450 [Elusimicrobia bacterium]|nr:hypothetical protein [Elusimicrobiota bacterium]